MSARLLAAFCLFHLVVGKGFAGSDDPPESELVVYLKLGTGQPARPLEHMKRELGALMHTAGYRVAWHDSQNADRNWSASSLFVVELRGSCGMPAGSPTTDPGGRDLRELASTFVVQSTVLPFSQVNCTNLTHILAQPLLVEAGARRDFLYGRAMARIVAHELYHAIANTSDHAHDGITKPCFGVGDLLSEGFAFEQTALARLQHHTSESAVESLGSAAGESATGR